MQFVEDNGGESDTVNRLQVVNEVYREGRDATKSMQLQEKRQNREDGAQEHQPDGIRLGGQDGVIWHQFQKQRDTEG